MSIFIKSLEINIKKNFIAFLVVCLVVISCTDTVEKEEKVPEVIKPVLNEYGLLTDSLEEISGTIGNGDSFGKIAYKYGVGYSTIQKIQDNYKDVFDISKVKRGNDYKLYLLNDSLKTLKYFVYEFDKRDFVVFELVDTISVRSNSKEITVKEKEFTGIIDHSLYKTLDDANKSPVLALKLSEIFAWQIDFWAIQEGDRFSVLYDEEYIGEEFYSIGEIKVAKFVHRNEEYNAIKFDTDKDNGFYDEAGHSLRKAFLKAPLKFSRISSHFSNSRLHPILRIRRPHHGIDYAAPTGTPVVSVGDGIVIKRKYSGGAGNFVKIKHNSTYQSGYMHLSKYAKGLHVGSKVKQGDVIGYVGSTGLSTGPHLDFRFYKNGTPINYLNMKFPPSIPVSKEHRNKFVAIKDSLLQRLAVLSNEVEKDTVLTAKNDNF